MWKIFTLLLAFTIFSCNDLLDAENPNSLVEKDLSDPRSAGPMVNGSKATLTRAIGDVLSTYSTSTDELVWSGSRDDWQQLNYGQLSNFENEFTDQVFAFVGEARWWADEVIKRIEGFQSEGTLLPGDESELVRAYLYGATIYITIADMYTDFAFSSKLESGPAIGSANMVGLYDTAIGYLNKAIAISSNGQLQGMLARAHWSKAAWTKARERNPVTALINDAAANTAAAAALAAGGVGFVLDTDSTTPEAGSEPGIGVLINSRKEIRFSNLYIIVDPATGNSVNKISSKDPALSISLMDPIDNIPDSRLFETVYQVVTSQLYPDYTITSEREMYLILAEAALQAGDMPGFTTNINALRAIPLGGIPEYTAPILTPWVDASTSGVTALDLLKHERRVNLFLSGRRLTDHYRFNEPSTYWIPSSDAMKAVTFFPIAISEVRANTLIN